MHDDESTDPSGELNAEEHPQQSTSQKIEQCQLAKSPPETPAATVVASADVDGEGADEPPPRSRPKTSQFRSLQVAGGELLEVAELGAPATSPSAIERACALPDPREIDAPADDSCPCGYPARKIHAGGKWCPRG